jgi:tRNA A-37 threonylcarbamoyl transferase component Bud32
MAAKPVLAFESDVAVGGLAPASRRTVFEQMVRRLTGDGLLNLIRARAEVMAALRGGEISPEAGLDDALPVNAIPSVAAGRSENRVLAEIDQDGFAFAVDPLDEAYFNRRSERVRRQQNLLDVVLLEGRICIRKRFRGFRLGARLWGDRPVPAPEWARRSLWVNLGLFLYSEAAALLRLRALPFAPKVRAIDVADRALYIDYVQGESLRSQAARSGAAVHDRDLINDPVLGRLSARELERREVALLDASGGADFRREIASMASEINACGVIPLDIKLGNFIRGVTTGRLYWIDFEISRLSSQPRWEADLAVEREMLEEIFDLSRHGLAI